MDEECEVKEQKYMKKREQLEILENEYKKSTQWDKQKLKSIARVTGLKESQVYKWNWDKRENEEKYQLLKN